MRKALTVGSFLLAGSSLVAAALAYGQLTSSAPVRPGAAALPLYCTQEPAPRACDLVTARLRGGDTRGAVSAVQELLGVDGETTANCHGLLHYIGSVAGIDMARDEKAWANEFPICGYGLLHGVYERLPLPGDMAQAGDFLSKACNMGRPDLDGACAHALGHDLVAHWPGKAAETVSVCGEAFAQTPLAALNTQACKIGVLMEEAHRQLRSTNWTAESMLAQGGFDTLTEMCTELPADLESWCAPSFVSAVTSLGPDVTAGFLQWCTERYPAGAQTCASWAGEHIGMLPTLSSDAVRACTGAHAQLCKAGLFDGARSTSESAREADARVCELLKSTGDQSATSLCALAARTPHGSVASALAGGPGAAPAS